ncbi:hypothetical protein ACLKA6_006722 [Drosophila palustris]
MTHYGDYEVSMPPSDSISALEFSPAPSNFLCAASWDQTVRIWSVEMSGVTTPKISCNVRAPAMDVSWSDDCGKIYLCTSGGEVIQWDLQSNQLIRLGVHDAGVRSCHWIKSATFRCLMTGSWDKTLKFWDTRSPVPMLNLNLPDRCYATDVLYPIVAVVCASNSIVTYSLDKLSMGSRCVESKLKQQMRCISLFRDKDSDSDGPAGFVVGGIEGRCLSGYQNIYAVNDVKHHPVHNTLATVGSDGVYLFWDTHSLECLFASNTKDQPVTKCCFNADGHIFAYALGYDWARGHEHYDPKKQPQILLHPCFDVMKPKRYIVDNSI